MEVMPKTRGSKKLTVFLREFRSIADYFRMIPSKQRLGMRHLCLMCRVGDLIVRSVCYYRCLILGAWNAAIWDCDDSLLALALITYLVKVKLIGLPGILLQRSMF